MKYQVCQDEYFRSKLCALLLLLSNIPCKNCHKGDVNSNKEIQYEKSLLTAPAKCTSLY